MKRISLLPADTYTIINKSIITEEDRKNIISLYEPLIGPVAVSLYFTLLKDVKIMDYLSSDYNHHHLMTIMKSSLEIIKIARESLEGVGLLKTYYKEGEPNSYVYEIYSPLSAKEFFSSPIFNIALYNMLGAHEYNSLKKEYTLPKIDLESYTDISAPLNKTFKSSPDIEPIETKEKNSLNIKLESNIDFDLLLSSLPDYLNKRIFNRKIKELIIELSFIYNLDTLKMSEIIRNSIDEKGTISEEEIRKNTRKYYQYNNEGKLPNLVYKNQPEALKSTHTNNRALDEKIFMLENTNPYDYLTIKNKGIKPTISELRLLEYLISDLKLTPAVVNVLVDYVLKKNNNKLAKSYVEKVASQWVRAGIKTAEEAITFAKKENESKKSTTSKTKKTKPVGISPSWIDKDIIKQEATEEEKQELDELLKEFR